MLRCSVSVGCHFIGIARTGSCCPLTALITNAWLLGLRAVRANSHVCRIFFRCRLPDLLGLGNRRGAGECRRSRLCLAEGGLVKGNFFLVFFHWVQIL